jgi:hypothetical protein
MMVDGIKSFVSNLTTGRPVMSSESVFEMTERIVNPHPPKKASPAPPPAPEPEPRASWEMDAPQETSRAGAIFDASQDAQPFNPSDFDFALGDEPSFDIPASAPASVESSPAQHLARPKPRNNRVLGMTPFQLAIIAALALALVCIVVGFALYYYYTVLS